MSEEKTPSFDPAALAADLENRQALFADYLGRERDLLEAAYAEKSERTQWWEGMITELRQNAYSQQLSSYKGLARSMATLLGGSIQDQAKIMVPFEIAEATKEFARFLGTRDPGALASSLKHALAAKQYAAAAKAGSPGESSGGQGGGGKGGAGQGPGGEAPGKEDRRTARVIVNVDRRIGLVDTYEFARTLIDSINENLSDDVVLEAAS